MHTDSSTGVQHVSVYRSAEGRGGTCRHRGWERAAARGRCALPQGEWNAGTAPVDGETLAAYLLMVRPEGSSISQLDYFAVVPAYRAGGLGAKLLAALPEYEAGAQAIIIEAEMPEKAEDEAMAVRRLGFYARCGARDTGYYEHLFDAWFRILVLPCPGAPELSDKDALDALVSCYKRTISESQWRKYVQFYAPDGSLRL